MAVFRASAVKANCRKSAHEPPVCPGVTGRSEKRPTFGRMLPAAETLTIDGAAVVNAPKYCAHLDALVRTRQPPKGTMREPRVNGPGNAHDPLFWTGDGMASMQRQVQMALAEVDTLDEARVLNTDLGALLRYFTDKYGVEVPAFDRANLSGTHQERQVSTYSSWDDRMVQVPGEAYDLELPFTGDPAIFKLRPNTFDTAPPYAEIRGNTIRFTVAGRELAPAAVKQEIERLLFSIEKYLGWHRAMWAGFETDLERNLRERLEARRQRVLKQKKAAGALADMGIRLKEKPGDTRSYVPAEIKRRIEPKLPPMRPASPPEPILDQAQYDMILGLIRDAGHSVEQSSTRMRELDEEALRDIFLVPLNAHFGTATGEAFNHSGKTDVLIRYQGSNLFVAEFKIWGGDSRFNATIDQLLGYLTWRDTKAAIVIFSRKASFTQVLEKIRVLAALHPAYVSGPVQLDDSSDRYAFALPQDTARHATVSILAFDLSG